MAQIIERGRMPESLESELRYIIKNSDGLFSIMLGEKTADGVNEMKLTDDIGAAMGHYRSGKMMQIWAGDPERYSHRILQFQKNTLEIKYFDVRMKQDTHRLPTREMRRVLTDFYFPAFEASKSRE